MIQAMAIRMTRVIIPILYIYISYINDNDNHGVYTYHIVATIN
jgi:hypothetical protein